MLHGLSMFLYIDDPCVCCMVDPCACCMDDPCVCCMDYPYACYIDDPCVCCMDPCECQVDNYYLHYNNT